MNLLQTKSRYLLSPAVALTLLISEYPAVAFAEAVLEEIVVSARRQEERLQDTPVAVSAFSEEAIALRNIQSVADVTNFAPNVQFDNAASESGGGSSSQISIRGIGQTDYAITVEPGVGLYLDGVYIGKSVGSLMDTVDLQRIEVLRGPQGTLFGKNTIGGAILLVSKKPSDEEEFVLDVTAGRYDRQDLKASVNLPLSDIFRVRGSFASLQRDGHVDRILDGGTQGDKDALSGRIVADLDIAENLSASLAVDSTKTREQSPGQVTVAIDENAFFAGLHNTLVFPACDPALGDPARFSNPNCANAQYVADIDDLDSTNTGPNRSDADVWGASLTLDWELEKAAIKSITAYRRADVDIAQELVGIPTYQNPIGQDITLEQFSQELQLSGRMMNDKLSYLVGYYYATEEGRQVFPVLLESVQFTSGGRIDNHSSAFFGRIGYAITDALSLTLGARYSTEKKRFLPRQQIDNVPDNFQPFFDFLAGATGNGFLVQEGLPLFPEVEVSDKESEFNPLLTLDYRFNENLMVYLSYSEGFKGGGFTMRGFPPLIPGVTTPETDPNKLIPSFGPETAEVYEIGLKSELFDNRVRLNIAAFITDYDGVQLTANAGPSAFVPVLINAGDAEIKGVELETEVVVTDWLRLNAGVGYLDSEYDRLTPEAVATGTTLSSEIPNSPEWTGTFGVTADLLKNDRGHLYLRTDVSYKSSQFKTVANESFLEQDDYTLVNAALTYDFVGTQWQATLGVTNLTDEIYIVSGVSNAGIGYAQAVVSRPREWYLNVKYQY